MDPCLCDIWLSVQFYIPGTVPNPTPVILLIESAISFVKIWVVCLPVEQRGRNVIFGQSFGSGLMTHQMWAILNCTVNSCIADKVDSSPGRFPSVVIFPSRTVVQTNTAKQT